MVDYWKIGVSPASGITAITCERAFSIGAGEHNSHSRLCTWLIARSAPSRNGNSLTSVRIAYRLVASCGHRVYATIPSFHDFNPRHENRLLWHRPRNEYFYFATDRTFRSLYSTWK